MHDITRDSDVMHDVNTTNNVDFKWRWHVYVHMVGYFTLCISNATFLKFKLMVFINSFSLPCAGRLSLPLNIFAKVLAGRQCVGKLL